MSSRASVNASSNRRGGSPRRDGPVDETFDLARHLHRVDASATRVRRGSNPADIVLTIARVAATEDFDRSRPLWDFTLIEHIGGERAALVMKLHHSLTDGVGGIQLALLLFDLEAYPTPPPPNLHQRSPAANMPNPTI